MNLWIGTSGFQYPEWKGVFYPEKLALNKMLAFYSERFSTTEINYTFRRVPSDKTIDKWSKETPRNFKFSLKAPQRITHFAKLQDCSETLNYFHRVISGLETKLGAILFQLPPNFQKDAERLLAFLEILPPGLRVAFEFRHASWFADDIFELLKQHNAALCIAESADLATPRTATADFGYLRLRREDYAEGDISSWASWICEQEDRWLETFVYFKHEEAGVGPKFARSLMERLANR